MHDIDMKTHKFACLCIKGRGSEEGIVVPQPREYCAFYGSIYVYVLCVDYHAGSFAHLRFLIYFEFHVYTYVTRYRNLFVFKSFTFKLRKKRHG